MLQSAMRPVAWMMLLAYAVLLTAVLGDFRAVMGDEACYVDPALRWCEGKGWTSTAWGQPPDEVWASNVPLYALSVAAWVKVTGLDSLWGLRLWSLVLYAAGLALWVSGARCAGWLLSSAQQAGFLALLAGSLYATGPSQYARPEALGTLLLGFALWGQTLRSGRWRYVTAFLAGLLASWAGLQFAVALTVFGMVWLLVCGGQPWRNLLVCGAGGLLGLVILCGLYHSAGVLGVFVAETFGAGANRSAQWHGWRDPTLWAGAAVLLAGLLCGAWGATERRLALAGLLAGPGLALALFALSKFPQYYASLAILPLATAVCAVFPSIAQKWRPAGFALVVSAGLIGFPLAALMNWNAMPGRQHEELRQWMESALAGKKAVFVDPSAYFAARSADREIYTQFVLEALDAADAGRIEAAVLVPNHGLAYLRKEEVLGQLGGTWRLVRTYPEGAQPASRISRLDFLSGLSYSGPYVFEMWQRER